LKTDIGVNYIQKLISFVTENAIHVCYKEQSVLLRKENRRFS